VPGGRLVATVRSRPGPADWLVLAEAQGFEVEATHEHREHDAYRHRLHGSWLARMFQARTAELPPAMVLVLHRP
jgi:hypothetical protein